MGEIEDYYNELSKYSRSQPEETIAERIKLMPRKRKRKKNRNWYQNLNFSLVANDLRLEAKDSWFQNFCQLCAEVSCLQ